MSATFGSSAGASIVAYRYPGASASSFLDFLMSPASSGPSIQALAQVGGKSVTAITSGGTSPYLYVHGDMLWSMTAEEPALSEIFRGLP